MWGGVVGDAAVLGELGGSGCRVGGFKVRVTVCGLRV